VTSYENIDLKWFYASKLDY